MTYKFDQCPRWWKEIYRYDEEIKAWSMVRFMLMKEIIELSLRFGDPFDAFMEGIAGHIRATRQVVSREIKALEEGGWLTIKRGNGRGNKSKITVNWGKLNNLYLTHEKDFNNMEKTYKSVNPIYPLERKKGKKSVNGVYPLENKRVIPIHKSVNPVTKSVNPVCGTIYKRKENDKERSAGSAPACQGQASPAYNRYVQGYVGQVLNLEDIKALLLFPGVEADLKRAIASEDIKLHEGVSLETALEMAKG